MIKEIWVVYEMSYLGWGVYYPKRYYYSEEEAAKDVADGGTELGGTPRRKMDCVKMLEKYQLDKR